MKICKYCEQWLDIQSMLSAMSGAGKAEERDAARVRFSQAREWDPIKES